MHRSIFAFMALFLTVVAAFASCSTAQPATHSTQERVVELYHKPTCPYCHKVFDHMEKLGITSVTLRDISADPSALETLKALTGKKQVPCLVIDGKPMLESDAIIEWMSNNLASAQ